MKLVLGPYPTRTACRTALIEAGYALVPVTGRRPSKWVHKIKGYEKGIQERRDGRWKIVDYPDLRRLDYRVTVGPEKTKSRGYRAKSSRP